MIKRISHFFEIPETGRYKAMEGLRAFAVFLAFQVHFSIYVSVKYRGNDLNHYNYKNISDFYDSWIDLFLYYNFRSHYGVDIFFLISGFLIGRMLLKRKKSNYLSYIKRRLLRIYPVFLITYLLSTYVRTQVVGQTTFSVDRFIDGLLLLDVGFNLPAWSLQYELVFYLLCPIIFLPLLRATNKNKQVFLISIFIISSISLYFNYYTQGLMFLAGLYLSLFKDNELKTIASWFSVKLVVVVYLITTTTFMLYPQFKLSVPIMMVGFSIFFIKVVFGTGTLNFIFSNSILRYIGNISYSFYLVHSWVIWLVFTTIMPKFEFFGTGGSIYFISAFILSISLTIAISMVIFALVEKPYFHYKSKHNR